MFGGNDVWYLHYLQEKLENRNGNWNTEKVMVQEERRGSIL